MNVAECSLLTILFKMLGFAGFAPITNLLVS